MYHKFIVGIIGRIDEEFRNFVDCKKEKKLQKLSEVEKSGKACAAVFCINKI